MAFVSLCLSRVLSEVPPDISYICDKGEECGAELERCFAAPRSYLADAIITLGDAAIASSRCKCWENAYRCYADCSNKFPFDFKTRCGADCPVDIHVGVGSPCRPRLNSYTGKLLPAVSAATLAAPSPVLFILAAAAAAALAAFAV